LQCHTKPLAVTLTFDLVTPKTIGVCVTLRTTSIPSLKVKGKQLLKLSQHIEGVQFHAKPLAVTLTFDLVTPKTIGVCVKSCTTCIPSLKVVGEKLLKLSQHIEVWTDGQTDRQADRRTDGQTM
jgi:hypothetical protein